MPGTTWGEYAEEASKAGGGFSPHPKGIFNMRVDSAEVKPAKNEKKAVLARMVTIDGPAAGESLLNNMTPFKNNGEPNGFFMTELTAMGFGKKDNPEFWAALDPLTHEQGVAYIAQAIVGAMATVTVNWRKYQDEWKDNVKSMVPLGTKAATITLEAEVVQPTLPGAAAIPGVASPAVVPGPAAAPAVAPGPVAVPAVVPVATPAPSPVAAVPAVTPVTPVEAAPAETSDVPAAPVTAPVAAPVQPVARPSDAPF